MFPKPKRIVDEEYLEFVRGRPCVICSNPGDPHHVKSKGSGGGDDQVVPLCRVCHTEIHFVGRKTFEKRYTICLNTQAKMLRETWSQLDN